jgi:hypothetical protein
MEAFISPLTSPLFDENPDELDELRHGGAQRHNKSGGGGIGVRRWRSRSRQRDNFLPRATRTPADDWLSMNSKAGAGDDELFLYREDPFKGF